ncbi:UPF0755 protein [Geothermobacter ehrlichii]|uniref:Endolytic murein transglycosylase n=1 Tax=Geothermobacter ehrlichii TaxID=213224 RepID=A0A5D3WJU4_9BACT|nr:endolytic transglycosylase MltG [Geothermobacter ehrlichii]TYO98577.1 UPF0755 protein [Geothermobacter ehrlichii]
MNANPDQTERPGRRRFRRILLLLALLVPAVIVLGLTWRCLTFLDTAVAPAGEIVVDIPPGSSLTGISNRLAAAGVVGDAAAFRLLARWRGVSGRIKAGEYLFRQPATPGQVLDRLVAGDVRRYRFTVPEGFTLKQIAERFQKQGFGTTEAFLRAAADKRLLARYAPGAPSLEGYLFPETYTIDRAVTPKKLLVAMLEEFRRRLTPDIQAAALRHGLNRHQLVTLASIVQKEAGKKEEMPLIAAVYHNRLRRNMPLQADPTVIYGIRDFDGNLTRRDLATPTPWNTYTRSGLPPGPIASPGLDALRAAAEPAAADYLYFVAKGDGTHAFSRTLKEHNRLVRKYQLHRKGKP